MKWLASLAKRWWRWAVGLPRGISIPAGLVLVVGVAAGAYFIADFYTYMQDDPDFCQSCHIMEESWDRWATSAHAEVGCHDCHHQSMFASAGLLFDFIFKRYERVEKHAAVQDEYCEDCHESGDPQWRQVAATSGHRWHAEEENIACTKCHSTTVHRFEPPGAICEVCHSQHMEVYGMGAMHCHVCHDFLVPGNEPLPTRSSCLDCHQATDSGVTWSSDDPMQYECSECHLPHEASQPIVECESCHTVDGYHLRGAHRATPCHTCHEPHGWHAEQPQDCLVCHPGKAEHNAGTECSRCHAFTGE